MPHFLHNEVLLHPGGNGPWIVSNVAGHPSIFGHSAAEVIHMRADAGQPQIGLKSTRPGGIIRKDDVSIAENYLDEAEWNVLNRIVNAYLEVKYGTPGSICVDVVEGPVNSPIAIYDLKTGGSKLTSARIEAIRTHLPRESQNIPIVEIRGDRP